MAIEQDQAVVIRLSEYSETSQIVALFTARLGHVRLIAKGARRSTKTRFSAGLDLLELGEAGFVLPRGEAGLGTLTAWTQCDAFSGLRRELSRLYGGLYVIELVWALTGEHDPHPELFDALVAALRGLAGDAPPLEAVVAFQRQLLTAVGLMPEFDRCVSCGRAAGGGFAYFSSAAGGLLCRDCEMHQHEKRRVSLSPRTTDAAALRTWFELLDYHARNVAGREFTAARQFVESVARANAENEPQRHRGTEKKGEV
ncbi:DNA repair protein RecO [Phycisphaerae bacterium RAS1]|nr:DNA repair protein RecO [Phycisphaerae bacterium RAS1]